MTQTAEDLTLAGEFPPATREQWLALVEGTLKGAPFEKRLVSKTYDGLRIEPLYPSARTAHPVAARASGAPWLVLQRVDHPDPKAANAEALHDLENGATGLSLVFAGSLGARGYGIAADADTLAKVLDEIRLDAIALELQLSPQAREAPQRLADLVAARGLSPAALDIRFGIDPIGAMAAFGSARIAWPDMTKEFVVRVRDLAARGFKGPFAVADGRVVHDAGGSEAQELAFMLSVALAYVRALEAEGIPLDAARKTVSFRVAADADQFLTIAKIRALRKLWARVETACGLAPAHIVVSAETAWRMMTKRDPAVNMLRATVAVFSAGVGGADALTVLPWTAPLGLPDRAARRIARNTQLILLEESYLAKVTDPAAGAGGIEALTGQLCDTAWTLFQEIESAGGIWAALTQGLLQKKVAGVRAAREKAAAGRRDPITGVSEFPNIAEAAPAVLDVAPPAVAPLPAGVTLTPLAPMRTAAAFEALRDASDAALAKTGSRPKVFLANLGRLAGFTARATFTKNFFEAGGIQAVSNDGFFADGKTDLAALAAAYKASGATLACLCSSDDGYAAEAVEAAKALTAAGCPHIYLAGRPGEREQEFKAAGIGHAIFMGCDVLATLQEAQTLAGTA
ncbi:methylmalonyl-CoA mutase family protein [Rhodoplanes sp. TEM]|uniref:Methylmalonyl-CoA mutase family protein n=1 Tax=Rhodoplanes tepidamans TaxID=200616 RepID=A0ABT5JGW5_RHOTP|nr:MULTISPECIES: methylmalonyl-CoA mutase family protein [Rhodoplanes]MDC7788941.1 methylmalonyl-CoA mutase family protein [Rhodoplanes tepidamans]MDC7987236.1 methylmalonyl-CoA mutase family protein [Rhodoplanes sp. TEM]MDQ0358635.1 methylmalonyl-CoA mutase [Rhodoplanes tepidamans]